MRSWWRRAGAALLAGALAWVATLALVVWYGGRDHAQPADAIVVLGAAQYDGRPSPVLRARLNHGIALWRRGLAPRLVVTGGRGEGDTTTEAEVGRRYALRQGIPDSAILVEPAGRSTVESVRAVARLSGVGNRRLVRVVLVSDGYHLLRLRLLARRCELVAYTSPVPEGARAGSNDWGRRINETAKVWIAAVTEWGD